MRGRLWDDTVYLASHHLTTKRSSIIRIGDQHQPARLEDRFLEGSRLHVSPSHLNIGLVRVPDHSDIMVCRSPYYLGGDADGHRPGRDGPAFQHNCSDADYGMFSDPCTVEEYRASSDETLITNPASMYDRVMGDSDTVTHNSGVTSGTVNDHIVL